MSLKERRISGVLCSSPSLFIGTLGMFRCFLQGDYERVRDRLLISGDLHGLTVPLGQTEDWPEDSDRNKSYGDDIDL